MSPSETLVSPPASVLDVTPPPRDRIGYVVKVYPRFSETFVVTEILAREAAGEDLAVYALRPTTDSRFHPQLGQVRAPVTHLPRPHRLSQEWDCYAEAHRSLPGFGDRFGALMPLLTRLEGSDVAQAVDLAIRLRRDGITRVHVHFASLACRCAAVACALAGLPFTVTTHAKDLFHDDVDRRLLHDLLTRAETVIAISDYNRRFLVREIAPTLEARIRLVRNGIDLDRFPFREPRRPGPVLRVLAVGRLVEKKGFGHLVDAAHRLHRDGVAARFRIVGEGDLRADLLAAIDATGTAGSVSLTGPRSQRELLDDLEWADVIAAPCVVGGDGNADGLPTVLLEAMAAGVPCIATDVTGIREAVHPADPRTAAPATGVLLPADPLGLAQRLADALRMIAAPHWPRVEIARAARDLVEREFDTRRQSRRMAARPEEVR